MSKSQSARRRARKARAQTSKELLQGVKLRHTLYGHQATIGQIAWSQDGQMLASPSEDGQIYFWNVETGELTNKLDSHIVGLYSVSWSLDGRLLAAGGGELEPRGGRGGVWAYKSGELIEEISVARRGRIAWSPTKQLLAYLDSEGFLRIWPDVSPKIQLIKPVADEYGYAALSWQADGQTLAVLSSEGILFIDPSGTSPARKLAGSSGTSAYSIACSSTKLSNLVAAGGENNVIYLWDSASGKKLTQLEAHTANIESLSFSSDGRLLASRANSPDNSVRIWRCDNWETVAVIPEEASGRWPPGIAFHPHLPILATLGERDRIIRIWELDLAVLLGESLGYDERSRAVRHTTAKIVLVGDSGVGKTGLGWKLAHGEFKEHASTHGQQFWALDELGTLRRDGTECEAILWDLAGQPDYRLTHALFLDDADLALILFDPTDSRDPMHGVEFWLKHLKAGRPSRLVGEQSGDNAAGCPMILVGARVDRGEARLTQEELDEFCRQRGIISYLPTSAKDGSGLIELLRRMKDSIPWEQKTTTVTTVTFKRIKDYVLAMKEGTAQKEIVVSPKELRRRLETEWASTAPSFWKRLLVSSQGGDSASDSDWQFTDAEMMTAAGHLANYGYVRVLQTSKGEECILLAPEMLNNLAASLVLEARRNPKGLGSLEERRLLAGEYQFRELEDLSPSERDILLDSAALLFLEHNICFRETDPLSGKSYLVFPELINLKKPLLEGEAETEDGVAYTVSGAVENVYASLVVLLGYTQTFTRTNQWRNQARYEVGDGLICGFRQDAERDGELDFVVYFGKNVGQPVRTLFQGLFESFLGRRNLTVFRYEPLLCTKCGRPLDRSVVRTKMSEGKAFTFCSDCGEKLKLPQMREPIQFTLQQQAEVDAQRHVANLRTGFEQVVFRLQAYVKDQGIEVPACFISYAWGEPLYERWVERALATDLQKAGINVVLDRWENARIGASVMRFMERIEECDKVIVVGTPTYRDKYGNKASEKGHVLATEGEIIALRKLGGQEQRESVLPVLIAGDEKASFPLWLQGHVYADFRDEHQYFVNTFDLIISLYGIKPYEGAVADLRESLQGRR